MDQEQLQQIRRLLALVDRYGLAELVLQEDGVTVTIRGQSGVPPGAAEAVAGATSPGATMPPEVEPHLESEGAAVAGLPSEEEAGEELHRLYSPMTGIFYRTPSPEARPFVEAGDPVEEGQTVGLIEAMKVYSEIPADVSGRVVRVLAESGKMVTQGEVLMLIDLAGGPV